jgi:energy-coupling factor transporter ATP-binding protein EcfA2
MKIKSIKIKGWRSFNDTHGIELNNLKKINLIIGPNNSGKSNLLKFFHTVVRLCSYRLGEADETKGLLNCTKMHPPAHKGADLTEADFWSLDSPSFESSIIFEGMEEPQVKEALHFDYHGTFGKYAAIEVNCIDATESKGQPIENWRISLVPKIPISYHGIISPLQILKKAEGLVPMSTEVKDNPAFDFDGELFDLAFNRLNKLHDGSLSRFIPLIKPQDLKSAEFLTRYTLSAPMDGGYVVEEEKAGAIARVIKPLASLFLKSIYCISPTRDHNREAAKDELGEDGARIVAQCLALKNSKTNTNGWGKFKDKLENWLCAILGEPMMQIDFDDRDLRFRMHRGNEMRYQYFNHLGTGVSQLFMLLAYLLFNKERILNVFLDEPENSLHSHAVAQLVKIFEEAEFANHRFFICTHAPSLMDMVTDNWTVHRVSMSSDKGTQIQPCLDIVSRHSMLDEMGIRASQILQSNLVIWVEGPSDRQYIRAWIKILSDGKLKEGKHFSFAFYGGSVLNHYGFEDPSEDDIEECISLFSTSRYSYIVMDSDKSEGSASDKPIYTKLKAHLEVDPAKKDYIKIWQTAGREIENYVPEMLWLKMATVDILWRKTVKVGGVQVQLKRKEPDQIGFQRYTNFADFLYRWYSTDNGFDLSSDQKEIVKFHDSKKVEIAKFMAEKWSSVPVDQWLLDLHSQVSDLVKQIKVANGIKS